MLVLITSITLMQPLRKIKLLAERMGEYDITTDIKVTRNDEFEIIGNALNKAQ